MNRLPATKRTRHYGARAASGRIAAHRRGQHRLAMYNRDELTGVEAKAKGTHADHDKACK